MLLFNNVCLIFLLLFGWFSFSEAETSPSNPFIWQMSVQFDLSQSNRTKKSLPNTSLKIYSQDFQTVYELKDRYGYNERLLLNFGDGCPGTTITDVQDLNGGWVTSPSMMSQPSIALVERGGSCLKWSDKIETIQELSNTNFLQVTGIVIYDNIAHNNISLIQKDTNDPSYPNWTSPLPLERDIKNMTEENIVDKGKTFVAVYFVPKKYIQYLNETLLKPDFQKNGTLQIYTQLTFFLQESHFTLNENTERNGNRSSGLATSRQIKSYVIFSIASVIFLLFIFLAFKWRRAVRYSSRHEISERGPGDLLMMEIQQSDVIPFEKLGRICPVVQYQHVKTSNTTCAICLDDFQKDYYIRVLPCHHGYCTACIDVWLTKKSSQCPICKYDCKNVLKKDNDTRINMDQIELKTDS